MDSGSAATIRVGPAGWSYEDWKGIVYPTDMPRSVHPLTFLSGFFDTVEVNATFYRPPSPNHCASWVSKVGENPRFVFTLKLWQRFTHERETFPGEAEVGQVREGIAPLHEAGKLGALLMQFPWSFRRTPENRTWLARVIDRFDDYPLALELRHASWDRPEVYQGLAQRNVAFCSIDQPQLKDSIAPSDCVTAPLGYVRFHGRNAHNWIRKDAKPYERYDYLYKRDELGAWLGRIKAMCAKADELFIITNNHYRGQAVVNAFELANGLGVPTEAPPAALVETYPRLRELSLGVAD